MLDNKNDLISIVVPIYNSEKYLTKCIQSICNQTYQELQIILVNDGSKDNSINICNKFSEADNRIVVINTENKGAVSARKKGMSYATGKYATIIDSDDWLESDMIEKLHSEITTQCVELAMCGRYEEYGTYQKEVYQGISPGRYDKKSLRKDVYPNMIANQGAFFEWGIFPSIWDKLVLTDKLKKHIDNVDDDLPLGNDAVCVYPMLLDTDSIFIIDECLYHYRQTTGSIVHSIYGNNKLTDGFRLLYKNGIEQLNRYSNESDMKRQWLIYLMFLLLPRIYAISDRLDKNETLFPFDKVKRNNKIAIYGLGLFGRQVVDFINRTSFCELVIGIDRNYQNISMGDLKVIPPEEVGNYKLDNIIICSSYEKQTRSMINEISRYYDLDKIQIPQLDKMLEYIMDEYSDLRLHTK